MVKKTPQVKKQSLTPEERAALRASVQQSTTDDTKKKWGQGRTTKPEEVATNLRVARELISQDQWDEMERLYPGDLARIAQVLELPVAAVIWRARAQESEEGQGLVALTDEAVGLLSKPATGTGGIQSLLRKLQAHLEGNQLTLRRREFARICEYLVNLQGGGRARLQPVMDCARAAIEAAGGIRAFFVPAPKTRASKSKSASVKTKTPARPTGKSTSKVASKPAAAEARVEPVLAPPPPVVAEEPPKAKARAATPEPTKGRSAQGINWKLPIAGAKKRAD